MVEVGRVELPSENMMTQLSTSVAVVQVFPLRRSHDRSSQADAVTRLGSDRKCVVVVCYV